jgi:hypothetical protein
MLVWRTLVSNFQEPEDETDDAEWVQAIVKFARELTSCVSQELALVTGGKGKGKKDSKLGEDGSDGKNSAARDTLVVIGKYADAIASVSSSKSLKMVIAEPDAGWELPKMLVPDHLPLGVFLAEKNNLLSEAKELKKLGDLKALLGQVPRLESAAAAMSTRLIEDEALKSIKTVCGLFLREFELAFISSMKVMQSSPLRELEAFLGKFKPIKDLCTDWSEKTEDTLIPLFEGKGAKEDFAKINQCMEGLVADLNAMKPFLSHSSSTDLLKELISFGKEIYSKGVMAVADAKEVAGTILLSAYFIEKEDGAPTCTMAELVKCAGECYGLKPEDLKGKFREMVAEVIATEKSQEDGDKKAPKKSKGSQPMKNEKVKDSEQERRKDKEKKDNGKKDKKQKVAKGKKDKKGK